MIPFFAAQTSRVALVVALCATLGPTLVGAEADGITVTEQSITGQTIVRGRSVAAEQEFLNNPVPWRTIKEVVPDGAKVSEGQVVAVFDPVDLERDLEDQLLRKRIDDLSVERDVANIDNELTALQEQIDDLAGQLTVAKARLATLEALPSRTQVTIDTGRLKLAEMNHAAAEDDRKRANDRFERGLIGAGEVARLEAEAAISAARLAFAQERLRIAQQAADPHELERAKLVIANLELDLDKQRSTYAKRQEIAKLRRSNAMRRNQRIDRKIAETREDLEKLTVTAPTDGFVLYTDRFKRALSENGGKLWRNNQFMRIPNSASVIFRCTIAEHQRSWFAVGDQAVVAVPGAAHLRLAGTISEIGNMPRDREADNQAEWAEYDTRSGVKVYDVTVSCDTLPDSIRPGLNVIIELQGTKPITAKTVPLTYVRYRDGVPHLAIDGHETPIEGQAIGSWFVIEDGPVRAGDRIVRHGQRDSEQSDEQQALQDMQDRFRVSGELIPTDTVDVRIGRIHWHGSKITWLKPEGERVNAGEVIAKLDDEEIRKEIEKQESEVESRQNTVDTEAEELALLREESALRLAKMKNDLRKAEIDHHLATATINEASLASATRDLRIAEIRLAEAQRILANLQARDPDLVSASEITRQERQVLRATLQREQAQINRDRIAAGPTALQRRKADLDLLRTRNDNATTEQTITYDLAKRERSWRWAQVQLQRNQRWLDELKDWRQNLNVTAPTDGLLQYSLIRSDGGLAKVQKGHSVRGSMRILSIADTSAMAVRLPVPEAYFTTLHEGMRVTATGEDLPPLSGTVDRIEFVFEPKRRNDTDIGLYSEREPSGETVFYARVTLDQIPGVELKPGAMVDVTFPFSTAAPHPQPLDIEPSAAPEQAVAEHRP